MALTRKNDNGSVLAATTFVSGDICLALLHSVAWLRGNILHGSADAGGPIAKSPSIVA